VKCGGRGAERSASLGANPRRQNTAHMRTPTMKTYRVVKMLISADVFYLLILYLYLYIYIYIYIYISAFRNLGGPWTDE
jgi:hypothetical protein